MSFHHIRADAKRIQSDEVLLANKADFHFPIPFIGGPTVVKETQ